MISANIQNITGFDISTLVKFKPPRAHCPKCLALLKSIPRMNNQGEIVCPVCDFKVAIYPHSLIDSYEQYRIFFRNQGLYLDFNNLDEHCRQLALIANEMQYKPLDFPPLKALLASLNTAQQFIHITSYGISPEFLLTLKLLSYRLAVRGIISVPVEQSWLLSELSNYAIEGANIQLKVISACRQSWNLYPHQKLIIIDGLMAFKGSANLTLTGWRKAARGYDEVEIITDIEKVITLHNCYFSPIWANLSEYGETINIAA
ncbi:MAG TPA: phospholipase D-like domain-containing protein [Halomicronema sp.]